MSAMFPAGQLQARARAFSVFVLCAALTACGGGGSSGSGSGAATSSTAGATGATSAAAAPAFAIALSVSGPGTVTSSPAGISCSGTNECTGTFKNGTTVTLHANSSTGASISTWGGDCAGNNNACTLQATDGRKVSVAFVGGSASGSASASNLSIRVSGNQLIDVKGNPVQLRGVNISGLETVAIQGWDPANPWGGVTGDATPNWNMIKTWGANAVRLPLNEASWLGLSCVDVAGIGSVVKNGVKTADAPGTTINADPGSNYQATVAASVASASAAGLYVILDLHWTAPGNACPMAQNPMADDDHSIAFWTSVAKTFKGDPNVIFELFNEPYLFWLGANETDWGVLQNGGGETQYVTGGTPYQVALNWTAAGMQQMVDAVRATSATNVILSSGVNWAKDLSSWLVNKPNDPLHQLGAVWHAYPAYGTTFGTPAYIQPDYAPQIWSNVTGILAAGYPVVITEYGDHDAPGTTSAPFASNLLPWADLHGVSYMGWTWDLWQNADNVLITDEAGAPTPGFGVYVRAHYLCRAAGTATCP